MFKFLTELSENARIALVGLLAVSLVVLLETRPWSDENSHNVDIAIYEPSSQVPSPPAPLVDKNSETLLKAKTSRSIRDIDPELELLLASGEFATLKDRLLNLAASAVEHNQSNQLIEILSLLAEVSIEQQNLDAAEVYLYEALDVVEASGEQQSRGEILMQLGRTHLKSREIARSAGYSYDALQIGRNQLVRGRFNLALENIQNAIDHSLAINRFNAAASAYSSLAILHQKVGNQFEAEQARMESVRLYSSSGQIGPAKIELAQLRSNGVEEWRLFDIEKEIDANFTTYKESINQIAVARDYQRLYHYYLNQNDLARAWHFRLLASKSLENISKRAMFHRQQGVLAILYNSNDSMARAQRYFTDASDAFANFNQQDLRQEANQMINRIY